MPVNEYKQHDNTLCTIIFLDCDQNTCRQLTVARSKVRWDESCLTHVAVVIFTHHVLHLLEVLQNSIRCRSYFRRVSGAASDSGSCNASP